MMSVKRCDPCGKSFTGPACYNQHLASEKHKKKVSSMAILNGSSSGTSSQIQHTAAEMTFKCSVCETTFSSLSSFQDHSLSPEHAQKVIEKHSKMIPSEVVSSSDSMISVEDNNSNVDVLDEGSDNILSSNEMIKSQIMAFATCDVCKKMFSGPEPYKQHIESAAHKKKVELHKNALSGKTNQITAQFSCDICDVKCSGQVPYLQHMNSEIHKKKMALQLIEKEQSKIDSVPKAGESNVNNPWFCDVCKIPCTGKIPFDQHLKGSTHAKNMARAQQNSSILGTISPSYNTLLNDSTENMDTSDSVLPGLGDNCNVMSMEELQKSVAIFLPDEIIDFDVSENRLSKQINQKADSLNEVRELEGALAQGIEANSDVNHICNFCNVYLRSKEEAINHFDSLEHYSKLLHMCRN